MARPIFVIPPYFRFYGTPNNWPFAKPGNELNGLYAAAWSGGLLFNADYVHRGETMTQYEMVIEHTQTWYEQIVQEAHPNYRVAAMTVQSLDPSEVWLDVNPESKLAAAHTARQIRRLMPGLPIHAFGWPAGFERGAEWQSAFDSVELYPSWLEAKPILMDLWPYPRLEDVYPRPEPFEFNAIDGSRGCLGRCRYCIKSELYKGKLQQRSGKSLAAEIAFRHDRYGIERFYMLDNMWIGGNVQRLWTFRDYLRMMGLQIKYMCEVSPEQVTKDAVDALVATGCTRVKMGVEVYDDKALKHLGRGHKATQVVDRAVALLQEAGIELSVYILLLKVPGVIEEDAYERTLAWLEETRPDYVSVSACAPYPGTRLYRDVKEEYEASPLARLPAHDSTITAHFWGLDMDLVKRVYGYRFQGSRTTEGLAREHVQAK